MSDKLKQEIRELIDKIRACRMENITQTRSYTNQIFVLAGAISAFLMPVFFLTSLSPLQHICLMFALIFLLGSIIFGVVLLSIVLGQEAKDLAKKQESLEALEDMKPETFLEISKQFKQYKYRRSHDLRDIILLGLFTFGVFLIMMGIVFGAWGL